MKEIIPKEALRAFKPQSSVFVLSYDNLNGRPNGMIANWHMTCSYDPPLIAVALQKQKNTQRLIQNSKEFVIAVANKELEKAVRVFGYVSGKDNDKFEMTKVKTQKSKFLKTPLLKDATLNYECKLFKKVDVGDHIMFIGKILAAYINKNKKILFNTGTNSKGIRIFKEL